jgi:alkanesulfonate monooxygenase SsuD/methylene tetrahydromethanopterin reductase-like flavin-dependent oxidoreductase (luciferase family)
VLNEIRSTSGGGAEVCGRQELKKVASVAEELDFDSILIGDHIVNAKKIDSAWPCTEYYGNDLKQLPFSIYTDVRWLDMFDALAFLAAVTEKARLGTSVLSVPYRNPYDVARRIASLDVLSGGRMILGVGVGWMEEEFQLLGIPFNERAQRTREYVAVMKRCGHRRIPASTVASSNSIATSICCHCHCKSRIRRFGSAANRCRRCAA